MNRRDFVWTVTSALAATFATSFPVISSEVSCSFCDRRYPEAAWMAHGHEGEHAICDRCADDLDTALEHLKRAEYDEAVVVLKRSFSSQLRAVPYTAHSHFLMM